MIGAVAGVVGLSSLAACGTTAQGASGISGKTIKVGLLTPLSGPAAAYSQYLTGFEDYLKYENQHGGVNGYKFDFVVRDDKNNGPGTVAAAREVVAEHPFLIAETSSSGLAAAEPFLVGNAADVPVFANASTSLIEASKITHIYGMLPDYVRETYLDMDFLKSQGAKKVGILYEDDPVGIPEGKAGPSYASSKGLSAQAIALPPDTTDYAPYVAKLRSANVDAVAIYTTLPLLTGFLKAASDVGWHPTMVTFSPNSSNSFLKLTGSAGEGTYVNAITKPLSDSAQDVQLFNTTVKQMTPNDVSSLSLAGWSDGMVVAKAVQSATAGGKKLTSGAFTSALEGISGQFGGLFGVQVKNHSSWITTAQIMQAKGGQFVPVGQPTQLPSTQ